MDERLSRQLRFEIEQLDRLLQSYAELLHRVQEERPDLVDTTAVASVLHSFYNGLESIFLSIAKGTDSSIPQGEHWHRELLLMMTRPSSSRPAVLHADLATKLAEYLGFRHFYRHSYSFFLDWEEMEGLVVSLREVWKEVRRQLLAFLSGSPTP